MDLAQKIEEVYGTCNIYKTFCICSGEEEAACLAQLLCGMDYSVSVISEGDLEDERPLEQTRVRDFVAGHSRVLICSYGVWAALRSELEVSVIPEHSLLALGSLEDIQVGEVLDWLYDADRRGFRTYGGKERYKVITLLDEEISPS